MGLPRINYYFNANNYTTKNDNDLICYGGVSYSGNFGTVSGGIGAKGTLNFGELEENEKRFTTKFATELKYITPSAKVNDKISLNLQSRIRSSNLDLQGRETVTSNFQINENNSLYLQGCITTNYSKKTFNTTFGGGAGYTHKFENGIKLTAPEFWVNSGTIPELSSDSAEKKEAVGMINVMLTIPIKPFK